MQLVDSHCHINFSPLAERLDTVLENARANDVAYLLCVAVDLEAFPQVLDLARRYSQVFASVGVHPNETEGREPSTGELVALGGDPRVIAVGETGLDYFRSQGDLDWQRERFVRHIEAAKQLRKPLIIHSRDAAQDTQDMLRAEHAEEAGGVMHCFADDWPTAKAALDLGFYISFSGIATFKNAESLREVARRVPADRLLVETDSPYLAPAPYRGKTNEPAYVRYVAEGIASARGQTLEAVAAQTTANFFTLFAEAGAIVNANVN